MKQLQRPGLKKTGMPGSEEKKGTSLDDRLAAADTAFYFGAPTAFLVWLLAITLGAEIHLSLPPRHLGLGVWGLLVLCGFLFPHAMHDIFGAIWERLLQGYRLLLALLIWR